MHLPAFAQALGFGQPGQGFIFFHLLQNRCCIIRSYLLQTVISKGDTDMTPRMQIVWSVLEAAKDAGDTMVINACRRIITADRIGWRKHGNTADLRMVSEFYEMLRAD